VVRNLVAERFADGRHGDALVAAAIDELVASVLADGRAASRTLELFGPPRQTLVIDVLPLHGEGRAVGALALIGDITERRRLEAVRRDFVANISHELKTPVGALSLLAETMIGETDPAVGRRLAERMMNEAIRVAHTIEDLIQLSRIEAEEAPEREPVAVAQIVAEAVTRLVPAAEHAGIALDAPEPDRRLTVLGDRRQLVSAVANLIDNAVKYADPGSVVEVRTGADGHAAWISVADDGIGIPARDLERVFERFYRVDHARSRQTGGTGLGLAIVRHVVNNHQGEIEVDSRMGEGSTFTLRLPSLSGPVAVSSPDERSRAS
jgi:two-component system sensor histidine kinase SenX3